MPMPRRRGFIIEPSNTAQNLDKCVLSVNKLDFSAADKAEDGFESLSEAMSALKFHGQETKEMEVQIESHPLFATVKKEYAALMNVFLPGFKFDEDSVQGQDPECENQETFPGQDPELTDCLNTFIALTRRRKQKAEEFYTTLSQFLEEYEKAIDELTSISADPVLKGSYLHEKISELKSTVKRKYGAKVQELQKECINKRRRANLPDAAVEVFRNWFAEHQDNPYPTDVQKQQLAKMTGVAEAQVSNWFVNVRKRYWKSR